MSSSDYAYTGQDNLEVMLDAVNYNNFQRNFIEKEIKSLNKTAPKVLDFGAGIGTYADMLSDIGRTVDCVEIDKDEVVVLKKNGHKVYASIDKVKTKYDIIYTLNVLEHLENDSEILGKLSDHLADGGKIVVFVPAFMSIFNNLDVKAEHLRRYRINDMKKLADDQSLNLHYVKYCDPVGFILAFVHKKLNLSGNLNPISIRIFDRILFPIGVFFEPLFRKAFGKNILAIYTKQ